MLTSVCKEYYQFILAQGLLGGISNGMTMFPAMAAGPQYFNKKRAAIMGLGIAGSSLGGVIWPIAMSKMLTETNLGFGWSIRIVGFVVLALLLPSSVAIKARLPPRKNQFFLWSAFKETPYLCLIAAGFLGFLGMFTPLFYLPVYASEQGMSASMSFYLTAIFNASTFPGRVIPGILADKLGRFNMFIAAVITSSILTFCWQRVHSNVALIVFAIIFGFCSGGITTGMVVCFTSIPKDPRNIGTYLGMGLGISAVAALVGPPVNGALINNSGFAAMADFSGAMCMLAAVLVIICKYFTGKGIFSNS
jgi:MFS family permease